MKIAIHNSETGFHPLWLSYCRKNKIEHKQVDCYANDIIDQLKDCSALMWHFSQGNPKDIIVARQILFALEHSGFTVFPDFHTAWHFDDKVGQKYLLEAIGAPMVPSYTFFSRETALSWAERTSFPKVFKLRGGAGSSNVKLVKNSREAVHLINKAFNRGFKTYDARTSIKERWRKFREGQTNAWDVLKGIIRLGYEPEFSKVNGRERGYVYFQDFIPNNSSDTRIIVIGNKAFALKRMVRKNDFRASGSGSFRHAREEFDERCVQIAFELTNKLKAQCVAFDFVFDIENNPLVVEISYGFTPSGYDDCPGYWDDRLQWHEGKFDPYGWMVENLLNEISKTRDFLFSTKTL